MSISPSSISEHSISGSERLGSTRFGVDGVLDIDASRDAGAFGVDGTMGSTLGVDAAQSGPVDFGLLDNTPSPLEPAYNRL